MALNQEKFAEQEAQKNQRRALMTQWMKTPEAQSMTPTQRASAITDILNGKGIPEPKMYNVRPGGALVTGQGDVKDQAPATTPADKYQIFQGADGQVYALDKTDPTKAPIPYANIQARQPGADRAPSLNEAVLSVSRNEPVAPFRSVPEAKAFVQQHQDELTQEHQRRLMESRASAAATAAQKGGKYGGAKPVALQDKKTGQIVLNFTNDDAENGDKFVRLGDKEREELRKLQSGVTHINEMNKYVQQAMISSGSAPQAFLNSKIGGLANTPAYRVLHQTLKPLTALAESGIFGQGTRAYRMVHDLQESLNTDTGTVASILEQEKATLEIIQGMMQSGGYSTAAVDAALKNITAMQSGKPNASSNERGRVTVVDKNGKKFTIPPEQLEEAKRQGYKLAPKNQ